MSDCRDTYTPEFAREEPCELKAASCVIVEEAITYLGLTADTPLNEVLIALVLSLQDARNQSNNQVLYSPQQKTEVEKSQARENIGFSESFQTDDFTYNGVDNTFTLSSPAKKVLNVFIDIGCYKSEVPNGAVTQVTINPTLLSNGVKIYIDYIK